MSVFYWALGALLILSLVALGYALYVKLRANRYTRERYAFAALAAIVTLTTLTIVSVSATTTPWQVLGHWIAQLSGTTPPRGEVHWAEMILLVIFVYAVVQQILKVFHVWNGPISNDHHNRELIHEEIGLLREGLQEANRILRRLPPLQPYRPEEQVRRQSALEPPTDSLSWRDQARELIALRWTSLTFDADTGWHDRPGCWIGSNVKRGCGAALLLLCHFTSYVVDFIRNGGFEWVLVNQWVTPNLTK